jgi:hypothetical protein
MVLHSGYIYLPLLFDPAIEREVEGLHSPREPAPPAAPPARKGEIYIELAGNHYLRALNLSSFVDNFKRIHKEAYADLRSACLLKYSNIPDLNRITVDERLKMILFEVMPHFIRKNRRLQRKSRGVGDVMDLIGARISVPEEYYAKAREFIDHESLHRVLDDLQRNGGRVDPPGEGLISAKALRQWFFRALEMEILESEKDRLRQALLNREEFARTQIKHTALLIYITEKGSLEVDGFGFFRSGRFDEYLIYKRTGEYALKDFHGTIYLFPDCRVGVSTLGPIRPEVIDTYKHPLLLKHDSRQKICVRRYFIPTTELNAQNIINALEEGVNAIFYGYSGRRRNGFHRLDPISRNIQTIDFSDYRITRDHPKIVSGEVEIKNGFY